jgi:hypothetical protein
MREILSCVVPVGLGNLEVAFLIRLGLSVILVEREIGIGAQVNSCTDYFLILRRTLYS